MDEMYARGRFLEEIRQFVQTTHYKSLFLWRGSIHVTIGLAKNSQKPSCSLFARFRYTYVISRLEKSRKDIISYRFILCVNV